MRDITPWGDEGDGGDGGEQINGSHRFFIEPLPDVPLMRRYQAFYH